VGSRAARSFLIRNLKNSTEPVAGRLAADCLRDLLTTDAAGVRARRAVQCYSSAERDLSDVARIAALVSGPVERHVVANLTHLLRRDEEAPTVLGATQARAGARHPKNGCRASTRQQCDDAAPRAAGMSFDV
jgi:hypothetical protein